MKPHKILYFSVLLTIILFLTNFALAGMEADVSTTLLTERDGGRVKGKIYIEGNKSRYEGTGADRGKITIADYDVGIIYFIDKQRDIYSEIYMIPDILRAEMEGRIPYGQWYLPRFFGQAMKVTKNVLRDERIENRPCTVYEIKVNYEGGAQKSTVWEDKELKIPLKAETVTSYGTKVVVKYENIKTRRIDPSLFEVPKQMRMKLPPQPYRRY